MGLLLLKRFLPRSNFFFNTIFLFRFLFSQRLGLPLFLFLDEKKKLAKRKIKAAAERAKTPAFRLNGNKLAALKQISVLIACSPAFLNARPTEALPSLPCSPSALPFSLLPPECAALFLLPPISLLSFFFLIYMLYNNVYSILYIMYRDGVVLILCNCFVKLK